MSNLRPTERCANNYMSLPVGQLVAERPVLAAVFEKYGIDYCCGGKSTLQEACSRKGLDAQAIVEKLKAMVAKEEKEASRSQDSQPGATDWNRASLKELVEHIIKNYHEPLRQELARVASLAEKVAAVHGQAHPEMKEVLTVFMNFKGQLELHMQKEEMVLFPAIVSLEATGSVQKFGCGGGITHPISVMNQEHDDAGEAMAMMRRLTHDYTPPPDACRTFTVLLYSMAQIESEMHQHVHKENHILFPRALKLSDATVS